MYTEQLTIILRNYSSYGAEYGKQEFIRALEEKGVHLDFQSHWECIPDEVPIVLIGETKDRWIQMLLENENISLEASAEGAIACWCRSGKHRIFVISGTDSVGLMYALLEMTARIREDGINALIPAKAFIEYPQNAIRCVDKYIMGPLDEDWFFSEDFWHYFLSTLAFCRYNRFCLITGQDTAYMAPPYPFFLEVKGYEHVNVEGLSVEKREKNLAMLKKVGQLCHFYGLEFAFASWQQLPWGGARRMVTGLPDDEDLMTDYCYRGLKELLINCSEIDLVQFRMNLESGVGSEDSAEEFWKRIIDAIADANLETGRSVIANLRIKGMTDEMARYAMSLGLKTELSTKYWCEMAGLPYHMTQMRSEEIEKLENLNYSRRYSYADLLKKPREMDLYFRLWSCGSINMFIWGDSDYAVRFSKSCSFGGARGFSISAPFALKYGHAFLHKEHWHTYSDKSLRSGLWEDERFWPLYIMFGRAGYNPNVSRDVWMREFRRRFGKRASETLEQMLRVGSRVMPLICAYHMPVHPIMFFWPEVSNGSPLFKESCIDDRHERITYGQALPSDQGLFYGIEEYVHDLNNNSLAGKYTPLQVSKWLEDIALKLEEYNKEVDSFEELSENSEFLAMRNDLSMLKDIAFYHAWQTRAAFSLAMYNATDHTIYLQDAYRLTKIAYQYWTSLSNRGNQSFYKELEFRTSYSYRFGNWSSIKCELENDHKILENMLKDKDLSVSPSGIDRSYDPEYLPEFVSKVVFQPPETHQANQDLVLTVVIGDDSMLPASPVLHYRHTNHLEGSFLKIKMERTNTGYEAIIPGAYIVKDWDLMVYITIQNESGTCSIIPGLFHPSCPYPYHVISII